MAEATNPRASLTFSQVIGSCPLSPARCARHSLRSAGRLRPASRAASSVRPQASKAENPADVRLAHFRLWIPLTSRTEHDVLAALADALSATDWTTEQSPTNPAR